MLDKITVVGAGNVGATAAQGIARRELARTVVPTLPVSFGIPLWFSTVTFLLLYILLLRLRVHLEEQRARLDTLYLSLDQ